MKFTHTSVANEIHELLDLPMDSHGEPAIGYCVVRTIINTMKEALHRGEDVEIKGFGIFRVKQLAPRKRGHLFVAVHPNIHSPVAITTPAKKVVTFIPSMPLQAMLNPDTPNYKERRSMNGWTDDN